VVLSARIKIESIIVPAHEIEGYRFIDKNEVAQYLDVRMAKIIQEYFMCKSTILFI